MADPLAIVGLVASIASLVDLSAKVVSRLHDFISETSDIPKSFRSLWVRLPVLIETLQRIKSQAEAGQTLKNVTKTLKPIVEDTFEQVLAVQTCLSKIHPPDNASKWERALNALKSLAKDDKIQRAMEEIDKNSHILILHQTTRHVDTSDLIQGQLTELTNMLKLESESFGKDELLSLARANRKTIWEEPPPPTQLMLSNSNRGLLFRFSQLPMAAQERFIAQQEKQLIHFVEQEEAKILEFFNEFDTRERLADQGRLRFEGTCNWILKSHEYLEWVQGNCNRLWLIGKPGVGKTVASAFITEDLQESLGDRDILAVYACSFRDSRTTSATSILCALAGQIAKSSSVSMDKCKRFLERHASEGKLNPEILDLQDLILDMSLSADVHRIFIVIDGLDEAEWKQRDHLMAVVDIPQRARKVKMLVTSRPFDMIAEALEGYSILSMKNVSLNTCFVAYVDTELERSELAKLPQQDFDEVKEGLIRKSDGMFIYAKLAINLLSDSYRNTYTFQQAKQALLQDLPRSLEEVYDLKMLNIQANNTATDALAVKTYLRILASSTEIVSLAELHQVAVLEYPELPYYTAEELAERAQGLLEWDPQSEDLRFIHFSVKEYMQCRTQDLLGDGRDSHRTSKDGNADVN